MVHRQQQDVVLLAPLQQAGSHQGSVRQIKGPLSLLCRKPLNLSVLFPLRNLA